MIKLSFTLNTNLLSSRCRILLIMTKKTQKRNLNSDDQQFHLYQQNEQSPLTSRSENTTKDQENKVGNPKRLFLCNSLDVIQQSIYQLLS